MAAIEIEIERREGANKGHRVFLDEHGGLIIMNRGEKGFAAIYASIDYSDHEPVALFQNSVVTRDVLKPVRIKKIVVEEL